MNSTFWPNCACPQNNSKSTMKCDPGLIPGERQIFFPELGTSTNSETPQVVKEQPSRNINHGVWYSNVKGLVIERSCSHFRTRKETKESFRFKDEDDNEYKIFSVLSSALAWTSVILAGKSGSRRHSTTSFSENVVVAGTSYQILEV